MKKIILVVCTILICIGICIYSMYRIDMRLMDEGLRVVFGTWGHDDYEPTEVIRSETILEEVKDIKLTFNSRDEQGLKLVLEDDGERGFDIYTYYGDVVISKGNFIGDFAYAIENGDVKLDDFLNKIVFDASIGECRKLYYKDGGSIEYQYDDYTVLKLNSLEGYNDLVIGPKESIINNVMIELRKENNIENKLKADENIVNQ